MSKRTSIDVYHLILKPEGLERAVKDKNADKRAIKDKGKQRNSHYSKKPLRHLSSDT